VVQAADVLANRYRLVDCLGEGGMAVVWRAVDEVLDRQVAVKVLAAQFAGAADSRARVLAEARAAARLTHPHIAAVYDYGESLTDKGDLVPFVVMELLTGRSLNERLKQGRVPTASGLRICAQVASALAAAHAEGLVHRDVKPGNVMLTRDGAKVVDFGIAAVAGHPNDREPGGHVLGTPEYLAPERLSGDTVIAASDVYALGLMLYRLMSGRFPWKAATATQMLKAHTYLEPEPLPQVPGVPPLVIDLIHRCLAKDPAHRPTSKEVAVTLALVAGIRVPLDGAEDDEPEPQSTASHDPDHDRVAGLDRGIAVVGSGPAAQRPSGTVTARDSYVARLSQRLDPALDHIMLRRRASLLLRGAVGFDLAIWCVLDPVTLMWASCVIDGGPYDQRLEHELFANEYGQDDVLKLVELADGPRVGTLSASTGGDRRTSARFRNVLDPRGFTDELRLTFHDGESTWGALCLYRMGGRFTDDDVVQLAPASRPLATALRGALMRGQAAGYGIPDDVAVPPPGGAGGLPGPTGRLPGRRLSRRRPDRGLPDDGPAEAAAPGGTPIPLAATVTVSFDGRLLAMGDHAGRLLEPGELSKVVGAVGDGNVSGLVDPTSGLRPDDRWLAFHAVPWETAMLVTVQRIRPHQMSELVARSLGLTWSQWQLLGAVARGGSTHQIARELAVSAYAVQDGLTSLFAAFGVDGRVNLIKALFFDHYLPLHARDARVTGASPETTS
jgi:Protein kinase domain